MWKAPSSSQRNPAGFLQVCKGSRRALRARITGWQPWSLCQVPPHSRRECQGEPTTPVQPVILAGGAKSSLVLLVPGYSPQALTLLPSLLCPSLETAFFVGLHSGEKIWLYVFLLNPGYLASGTWSGWSLAGTQIGEVILTAQPLLFLSP